MIRLHQTFGAHTGRTLTFDAGPVRIGRQPENELAFDPNADLDASGFHAQLVLRGKTWHLTDTKSRNGTWVNGERITEATLGDGDERARRLRCTASRTSSNRPGGRGALCRASHPGSIQSVSIAARPAPALRVSPSIPVRRSSPILILALQLTLCTCLHTAHAAEADDKPAAAIERLYRSGQSAQAFQRLEKALTAQPRDPGLRFLRALMLVVDFLVPHLGRQLALRDAGIAAAGAHHLAAADLDGDGRTDLAVVSPVGSSLLRRTDGGALELSASHPTILGQDAALADLDGDGRADWLVAGDTLRVYRNPGDGRFGDVESQRIELATAALAVADA